MLEFVLGPWRLLVLFLASQLNEEQQRGIEYLQTENQVLREKLGKGRILLSNEQRRRFESGPREPKRCLIFRGSALHQALNSFETN